MRTKLFRQVCLELAHDPVVTICGHLHCWPCLYRCASCTSAASAFAIPQHPAPLLSACLRLCDSSISRWKLAKESNECPVCKAQLTDDKVKQPPSR